MLRLGQDEVRHQAEGAFFEALAAHSRKIDRDHWAEHAGLVGSVFARRLAYWAMARLDPLIARWLWKP